MLFSAGFSRQNIPQKYSHFHLILKLAQYNKIYDC